ncbi:MAG TPA: ABC transporter substrate-binding protein, partial [Candidatus Binatia bacterium]
MSGRSVVRYCLLIAVVLIAGLTEAQQPGKIHRIGWLASGSPSGVAPLTGAFRKGLRGLGYVEGKNLFIEYRYADGRPERLPDLATEIVHLKVDVIVVAADPAIRAVQQATRTIPTVMVADDPLGLGFIVSLARPGGNLTGLSFMSTELAGKRLELLKETVPKLFRLAVLRASTTAHEQQAKQIEIAAQPLGLQVQFVSAQSADDLENAFLKITEIRPGALLVLRTSLFRTYALRIKEFAEKAKLPTMYDDRVFVEAGGLMSYGTNTLAFYEHAATYVDKILKGAKPADLPVEQPTKFEFFVNLKTAKQIGLTIPPNVL